MCRSFRLGKFVRPLEAPDILVSHSHFNYFLETSTGSYVFKFYPSSHAQSILVERLISKAAQAERIPTPSIHVSGARPYAPLREYLAVCYSLVSGKPLYRAALTHRLIGTVVEAVYRFNAFLRGPRFFKTCGRFLEKEFFLSRLSKLEKEAREDRDRADAATLKHGVDFLRRSYKRCSDDLVVCPVQTNLSLPNIMLDRGSVCFLDLCHVRRSYELNDLANLFANGIFLGVAAPWMKQFVVAYCERHEVPRGKHQALRFLIYAHMLTEFAKVSRRFFQSRVFRDIRPLGLYREELSKRRNTVARIMTRLNRSMPEKGPFSWIDQILSV